MGDFAKAIDKFLYRDLIFAMGGGFVVASLLYVFDRLPTRDIAAFEYFLGAGVCYVTGYAVQELFTLLRLVRTKAGFSPNWLCRVLYRLFDRKSSIELEAADYRRAKRWLYEQAPERFRSDHERIEALKKLGTVFGPCFIVSAVLMALKAPISGSSVSATRFEYALILSGGFLGSVLWLLGWLKVTQQAQYLVTWHRDYSNPTPDSPSLVAAPSSAVAPAPTKTRGKKTSVHSS